MTLLVRLLPAAVEVAVADAVPLAESLVVVGRHFGVTANEAGAFAALAIGHLPDAVRLARTTEQTGG